ncbi:retrovirus-related pol polyprotein from transposon TNT 1-94 [Tanacetum coccineum]
MKKFYKKIGRRVCVDGKTPVGFDKKKLECFNCHNTGHFARECTTKGIHDGKKKRDSLYQHQEAGKQEKNQMGLLTMDDGIVNWGEHTEAKETNQALMAISSSNEESLLHTYDNLQSWKQTSKDVPIDDSSKCPLGLVHLIKETLELAQESRLKMQLLNKEIKPANYTKINHLSGVFVSQMAKSREELYLSNTFKTANVSKSISIPNEEFSDDTTPSVARKFLNEVKGTIVTLQRVVKQKMTLDIHNWSSSAHQEIHKIVKDEIFPIVNQVDARVQNFKIQFLKEAAKFVRDFQSLANKADESLAKHKALELEIERLLRAVVSQDIMSIVQNNSIVGTSNLQTELERTKERFENCIIKKENEYAKLWNDWYKKYEECKYDKISYDKAYNDMQQKIKRLQAQLGDQKGKSKDTQCISNTLDPLPHKLENENIELEFQNNLHDTIYENAKLRAQLFDKVSEQKDTTKYTGTNTKFANQSTKRKPFLKSLRNTSVNSKEEKPLPNKPTKASVRTNPVIASQPHVIIKKVVNYDSNGFSSIGVDIISRTRRPQSRSNTKNDRSEIICAMCKQCLITANHDACVLNYVNGMNSRSKKQKANVSNIANQMKHKAHVWKLKNVGSKERLASPKPSKPNMRLRWSPTGKRFDIKGKIIESSESNGENACTPNPQEPIVKRFPNSTFFLGRNDLVTGLPKFKYHKEHLCPSCEQGKNKRASHLPKPFPNSKQRLHLLHMDLCGPMRIAIINGKRYVLVIVDDYSWYTWVVFLRSKDEALEEIKTFLKRITFLLQAPVIIVRTDNGTEFKNQVLQEYFKSVGISHQSSSVHTPQQNGVVERRNRTLVEAARTMLIFSRASLFLWNDREDIGKLGAKGDIGFFIGYSANSRAFRFYNRRIKRIMETINLTFDELSAMAFKQSSLKPRLQSMTSRQISSGLDLPYASSTITTQRPTEGKLDLLFEAMYDDHVDGQPSAAPRTVPAAQSPHNVDELETQQHGQPQPVLIADNVPNAMFDDNTFVNPFATPSTSAAESSSSQYVDPSNMHTFYKPYPHEFQ